MQSTPKRIIIFVQLLTPWLQPGGSTLCHHLNLFLWSATGLGRILALPTNVRPRPVALQRKTWKHKLAEATGLKPRC